MLIPCLQRPVLACGGCCSLVFLKPLGPSRGQQRRWEPACLRTMVAFWYLGCGLSAEGCVL